MGFPSARNQIIALRYYIARVSGERDPGKPRRQRIYLNALETINGLTIHYGHFLATTKRRPLAHPWPGAPRVVEVLDTEEKGSDVNLALHVLNDAWRNAYDCAVVVSNDSDLAESLRLVKAQHRKLIGLITPGAPLRKTSWQLRQHAHFTKPIRTWALEASQLPDPVPGTSIRKPSAW